jgi:Polysaccharide lyase
MNQENKWQYLTIIFLIFFITSCKAQLNIYDGFESQTLSNIWSLEKLAPHAIEIQSTISRSGKSAAKITLNTGDMYEPGNDSSKVSERAELLEAKELESVEEKEYDYSFSIFIPANFPIAATRLVVAQWKQRCEQDICQDRSPIIALRYESGRLFITLQTGLKKETLYKTEEDIRNKWIDFKFKIRFTRNTNGEIIASLNDKNIINYTGITSYSEKYGFLPKSTFYFKMGLYRDRMIAPMTIYIDEYRKQKATN